jgi:iron complex transport system ATP-binding protein
MSAGQQRRIMIGRALVGSSSTGTDRQMLLLDEPSNALDLAAQQDLRNLLRRLAQQGTGILLITHQVSDIIPEIDRILMMKDGRIVNDGPKSDLLTARRLSDLFKTEVHLTQKDGFHHAW